MNVFSDRQQIRMNMLGNDYHHGPPPFHWSTKWHIDCVCNIFGCICWELPA